jgi:hypothetical protein
VLVRAEPAPSVQIIDTASAIAATNKDLTLISCSSHVE